MADIRAAQSGNFSATTTWVGGVVPTASDVAYSNSFTITVDGTFTVQAISNAAGTGITVGGTFALTNGCSLTLSNPNGVVQGGTTASVVNTASMAIGQVATINGNIAHAVNTANSNNVTHSTLATLVINGNISGSTSNVTSAAVLVSGGGILTANGAIVASNTLGQAAYGINVTGAATVNITTSNVTGANIIANAIRINNAGANVTVNGVVNGGYAIHNEAGSLAVNASCQASATGPSIAPGGTTQVTRLSGPFLRGPGGQNAVMAFAWRWIQNRLATYMEVPNHTLTANDNLRTSDNMPVGGYPAVSNVLSTAPAYGDAAQYQGTYASPAASSVASGVTYGPGNSLTGTAVLTATSVRAALGMASANLDAQLANKATVDQVASIVEGATSA